MRFRTKRKSYTKHNLLIASLGMILITCFLWGSFYFKYIDIKKLNYEELKSNFPTIDDENAYTFLNQLTHNRSNDSLEFLKINCFALAFDENFKESLKKISKKYLSEADKKFMISQIYNEPIIWDRNKLVKHWLLTPMNIENLDKQDQDFWDLFRAEYGNYGIHSFTKPLFNSNEDILFIEHSGSGGWTIGSGSIKIYKKIEGVWTLIDEEPLWIS